MVLTTYGEEMSRALREVRLRGAGVVFSEMQTLEVSGDRTVTTFSQVDPARRHSEATRARIFRVAAP